MSAPVTASRGPHPLLVKYLSELVTHPLRTKAITSATLCLLQEVLGSNFAGVPPRVPRNAPFFLRILALYHLDAKALKMALYGFLVSAPMSHVLVGAIQKAFSGKTGTSARIQQIIANNLLVAPIQATIYLSSIAIINGTKTLDGIIKTWKAGFLPVLRITWIVSPLSMLVAQKYVPQHLWVPFFNLVQFVLGTVFNTRVKKQRLAASKKAKASEDENNDSK
ncbi:uncharacterized protein BT62DRAFT_1072704 [Guyanagaster necrorhizus]|uniref:Integral membrane protein n=1 Tax=Guyanagaster necrorhizus TaxID=856835 RepID=A0A9P8AWK4_9AGAR|nr:uncharacterized protein BT62DRAFT_1072704 [Guyanagaster necrorhizus MCA 3950]KAG7450663.1 hypothetical protein BT62DRAFT_1072704 [Guyanagaster necrorhizus MCA 3950]